MGKVRGQGPAFTHLKYSIENISKLLKEQYIIINIYNNVKRLIWKPQQSLNNIRYEGKNK